MRLIFSKDNVKREIETPFALCCSMDDLEILIKTLQSARGAMLNNTYGWMLIDDSHPCKGPSNTVPLKWTE